MRHTRAESAAQGAAAAATVATSAEAPEARSELYSLEYRAAADTVTRMVSRYLWVVLRVRGL